MRLAEARAVLECAASLGGVAPSKDPRAEAQAIAESFAAEWRTHGQRPAAPPDDRAEKLTRYRCAAVSAVSARCPDAWDSTDVALEAESLAHAMLAAERSLRAV